MKVGRKECKRAKRERNLARKSSKQPNWNNMEMFLYFDLAKKKTRLFEPIKMLSSLQPKLGDCYTEREASKHLRLDIFIMWD